MSNWPCSSIHGLMVVFCFSSIDLLTLFCLCFVAKQIFSFWVECNGVETQKCRWVPRGFELESFIRLLKDLLNLKNSYNYNFLAAELIIIPLLIQSNYIFHKYRPTMLIKNNTATNTCPPPPKMRTWMVCTCLSEQN